MSGSISKDGARPTGPSKQDLGPGELRSLLNQPVASIRPVQRPVASSSMPVGPFSHSGMEAITADDKRWLVHKGDNFGRETGGNTVVTAASHQSDKWKPTGPRASVQPGTRMTDLVRAGGKDYQLIGSNCHHATDAMNKFSANKK